MMKQTMFTLLSDTLDEDLNRVLNDTSVELEKNAEGISSNGNFIETLGLVLLLIIIVIGAYYTSKFVAGLKLGQLKQSNFQIVDSYRISPNKILHIVKIGTKYVVLAVAKDTVSFVLELEEDQLILNQEKTEMKVNFEQILSKISKNKK